MGVPAFYRWLTKKYQNVNVSAKEEWKHDNHYNNVFVDTTTSKPNGIEFDHLYLDMNGLIHPCFHPDTMFPPTTFEEVFDNIFAYIDRLFTIVRPRKLLYLAIDGVAPRAKMNQQRARRFRTAKDNQIADEEEKRLRIEYERRGKKLLPVIESQVSDSNVITPGTEFMQELSKALNSYIVQKLENDPGWNKIKVILSDATVPGEGEHKVMSFIRSLRTLPDYDPNTRHCLYGQDADLIMLALATHEIHFSILREDELTARKQKSVPETATSRTTYKVNGHAEKSSEEEKKAFFDRRDRTPLSLFLPQYYEFVHVWILREYLELDMKLVDPPEKFVFDIERIVDDFIFMCFFIGNDFLPHMPTLEIYEDGIDLLMHVYKTEFKKLGGYLVDMQRVNDSQAGYIELKRVEKFILSVGSYEEKIFSKRTELMEKKQRKILNDLAESRGDDHEGSESCTTDVQDTIVPACSEDHDTMLKNTKELYEDLKKCLRKKSDTFTDGIISSDKVKLGSTGWKQRYYKEKFQVEDPKDIEVLRKEIIQKYTEGLCWVLLYYFSDIPSWNWFYPFYYGLCASELKGLASVKVKFQKGLPFKPFDQLMAVLPPKSAHALPKAYRELMTDENSSIIDFYPTDFEIDTDGKRFTWQGICKLPFIDQAKLLNATSQLEKKLLIHEAERNLEGTDSLFWRGIESSGDVWAYIQKHYTEMKEDFRPAKEPIMCIGLELPAVSLHIPRLLEGVQIPEKTIFEKDIEPIPLWHEYRGRPPLLRPQSQQRYTKVAANAGQDNANEAVLHKHAGCGWGGAGRGRWIEFSPSIPCNNLNQKHHSPSDSAPSRGWFRQHPAAEAAAISNRNKLKTVYTSNVGHRMQSLRISPSQATGSYRRGRQYTQENQFWSSRNSPEINQNSSWRPASVSKPSPSTIGNNGPWRRTSATSQTSSPFQARGRVQYRPTYDVNSSQSSNRW